MLLKTINRSLILSSAGVYVIRQGDNGDKLFLVESGDLECYKEFVPGEEPVLVKTYTAGDSFGELALLYNVPRQASVVCKTDCQIWALDRETFNSIVKESAMYSLN